MMPPTFYIVGPTATGKSELAADVAFEIGAEIVSADAFQIYRELDLLSGKPDGVALSRAPHHLIGAISILEPMNAEKFRTLALRTIKEIHSRGKPVIVVGGSGLYVKALTHGLAALPDANPTLRAKLNALSLDDLRSKLAQLDPRLSGQIDMKNRRRVVRALEICITTGQPASEQREQWTVAEGADLGRPQSTSAATGVFVFRDREDLYQRINSRVEAMFENGVIEEVRAMDAVGETAATMIGLREIRELLEGKMSIPQCLAAIQQATRRYAKRQLTWFRRQTSFEPLNLSLLTHNEARISLTPKALGTAPGND